MTKVANQAMILTATSTTSPTTSDDYRGVTLSSVTSLTINPKPMLQFNLQIPSFTSQAIHRNNVFAIHLMKPNLESVQLARLFSKGAVKVPITKVVEPFIESNPELRKEVKESGLQKFFKKISERNIGSGPTKISNRDDFIAANVNDSKPTTTMLTQSHQIVPFKPFKLLKDNQYTKYPIGITSLPLLNVCDLVFICTGTFNFKVGDHEIWVGEVQDILNGDKDLKKIEIVEDDKKITGGLVYCDREFKKVGSKI
ncbi:conserved putative NADH-dependent flavin oxidoreductase [Saccharomycodes ludwigii]|nr:conserved putative NADH-dependent flavin oxidoreductase [Saccharomycodes ludwigii]KAH3900880.1 conserved putative NADH-dependent flavin oxidoreductase [Saccharomycodes ludwigii]